MKSVDRDYGLKMSGDFNWFLVYLLVASGLIILFAKLWNENHLNGLSSYKLFLFIVQPLALIGPLVVSLRFREYVREALKENLISERVAKNCEYWILSLLFTIYIVICCLV
jgi:hypothetical protein